MRCPPIVIRAAAPLTLAIAVACPAQLTGQTPIRDNSFLIEEAYNQERGVIQHIGTYLKVRDLPGWAATFTEEWPLGSERHQLSVTIPFGRVALPFEDGSTGIGDVALNYRFQLPTDYDRVAFAPRISVLFPTGDRTTGHGAGAVGWQANLPLSLSMGSRFVTHFNAGGTLTPSATLGGGSVETSTADYAIGGSAIWLLHQRFNVMVEALWESFEVANGFSSDRESAQVISPGVRAAFDFDSGLQIVPGIAVPIGFGPSSGETGIFLYLSFEHPFRRTP
jgi:hypothetical protein